MRVERPPLEDVHGPQLRGGEGAPDSPLRSALAAFARAVPTWAIAGAVALGALGAGTDVAALTLGRAPLGACLATGLATAVLGVLLAMLLAIPATLLAGAARGLSRLPRLRVLWPLPIAVTALVVAGRMTEMHSDLGDIPRRKYSYELIVLGFAAAITVLAALWKNTPSRRSTGAALALAGLTFTLDVVTPRSYYRDAHDLVSMIAAAGLIVAGKPAFERLTKTRLATLWKAAGALLVGALAAGAGVETVHAGWRAYAQKFGYYEPRLARTFRLLVDFDGDGFSPIAWGGDCDDFDPARNPGARETRPGVDGNCNGVAVPSAPTNADRGLAAPAGDPDLPRGAVDRFVLITVDCWRADTLRAEVMPRVYEFAERGLTFKRLYAAGSRTQISLPLLQRGSDEARPAAARLARYGVTSAAILGFRDADDLDYGKGFGSLQKPPDLRWTAPDVTDRALHALRSSAPPRYLWVHYYDAHHPYLPLPADFRAPTIEYPNRDYLARIALIDREIGRLLGGLQADGTLARTAVALTSDHGEGLGIHGVQFHGTSTYEPVIHVPGVLVAPGVDPGSYDGLASHRDFPATVVGAFGKVAVEADVETFGRSWFRVRTAPRAPLHRFVVVRSSRDFTIHGFMSPQAAIVEDRLKLGKTFEDGLLEMYDIPEDPGENDDIAPNRRADAARLSRELELYRDLDEATLPAPAALAATDLGTASNPASDMSAPTAAPHGAGREETPLAPP